MSIDDQDYRKYSADKFIPKCSYWEKEVEMTCEQCVNYGFYEMVTSGKPYGYSGTIPCFTCKRYQTYSDKFVPKSEEEHPVLPQQILKMDWKDGEPMDWVSTKMLALSLQKKQDEIIDVVNDMRKEK